MPSHKTSAWPLALVYLGLIVYASLYPFAHWRDQGISPWLFLTAPLPRYWTAFDVVSNVLGYMPLGFLLTLGMLRSGRSHYALRMGVLAALVLSLLLESLQVYLPDRVPSNLDLALNALGAGLGVGSAWSLEKMRLLQRWSRFRADWFVAEARGALVLLALWPLALLFPTVLPFGLGHVLDRLADALGAALTDSAWQGWLPLRLSGLPTALPAAEKLCVLLGLLIPCLLGYGIIAQKAKRIWFMVALFLTGGAATALSAALSFGPAHAWAWLTDATSSALVVAMLLCAVLSRAPPRACAAFALLALGVYLSLINQTPSDPYFEQTLFLWEQGRFIRFHGLAQWLGWVWPYAALVYVLGLLWGRPQKN